MQSNAFSASYEIIISDLSDSGIQYIKKFNKRCMLKNDCLMVLSQIDVWYNGVNSYLLKF